MSGTATPGPEADPLLFPKAPEPIRYDQGELDKLVRFYDDIYANMYSRAAAYNNIIMGAGYAGAFALWNVAKGELSPVASNWIVVSLGLSLIGFIGWQLFNMIWAALELESFGANTDGKSGQAFIDAYKAALAASQRRHARVYRKAWMCQLLFCIVTAMIGVGVLLVSAAIYLLRAS